MSQAHGNAQLRGDLAEREALDAVQVEGVTGTWWQPIQRLLHGPQLVGIQRGAGRAVLGRGQ
ncbi:hypothetical protein D3C77_755680 [compost metagenome]